MGRTAKDLTSEEIYSYRPWRNLDRYQKNPEVAKRRALAWEVARAAAGMLKRQFGATRVVAFGSLARKSQFTPWSDVDIAAWEIPGEEYYIAVGALMDLGFEFGIKVDLVDAINCSADFLKDIEQEGIEL